jgi:hypothetical protein
MSQNHRFLSSFDRPKSRHARPSAWRERPGWRCCTDKGRQQLVFAFSMPFKLAHCGGRVKPVFEWRNGRGRPLVVAALAPRLRGQVFAHGHQGAMLGTRLRQANCGQAMTTRPLPRFTWRLTPWRLVPPELGEGGRVPPSSSSFAQALEVRRLRTSQGRRISIAGRF